MDMYADNIEKIIETKIKPNLQMIYNLKIQGLKDKYIAQALGIRVKDFTDAKERYEPLSDLYDDAMMLFCSKLTDVVVGRALGTDGRTDEKGNLLPPDEKLAFKLLEKLDTRFSQKQENTQQVTIEMVIKEISEKRKLEGGE